MPERYLSGSDDTVSLNPAKTVGVMSLDKPGLTTNQTRSTYFDTEYLVEWAEAVQEAYGETCEVVFTPDHPMVAVTGEKDAEALLGIGIAPMIRE